LADENNKKLGGRLRYLEQPAKKESLGRRLQIKKAKMLRKRYGKKGQGLNRS